MTVTLRDSFLMTDKNDPNVLFYLYKIPYVLDGTLRVLKLREQRWLIILVNME